METELTTTDETVVEQDQTNYIAKTAVVLTLVVGGVLGLGAVRRWRAGRKATNEVQTETPTED